MSGLIVRLFKACSPDGSDEIAEALVYEDGRVEIENMRELMDVVQVHIKTRELDFPTRTRSQLLSIKYLVKRGWELRPVDSWEEAEV